MRKLLLMTAIVLLLLVTLLPGAVGWVVSRQHADLVAELDRQWRGARVSVANHQPGWFGSQLELAIRTGPHRLRLETLLGHGPFAPGPGWLRARGPVTDEAGQVVGLLIARLTLAGRLEARLEMFDAPLLPGTLTASIGGLGRHIEFRLANAQHVRFSDLDLRGTINLELGNGRFELTSSRLSDPSIALFDSRWQLDFQTDGGFMTVNQSLVARRLGVTGMNRDFGPSRLRLRLQHLHQPTLASVASSGADALPLLLPLLLNHQPELVVEELFLDHPDGTASLDGRLAMLNAPPGGWLSSPALLSRAARGQGQARISAPLLENLLRLGYAGLGYSEAQIGDFVASQVKGYQQQGLLEKDAADWVSRWSLDEGVLILNGQRRELAGGAGQKAYQAPPGGPMLAAISMIPAGDSANRSAPAPTSSSRLP